jgi:hypothetical protein
MDLSRRCPGVALLFPAAELMKQSINPIANRVSFWVMQPVFLILRKSDSHGKDNFQGFHH